MVSEVPTDEGPTGPVGPGVGGRVAGGPGVGGGVDGREFGIYTLPLNK